MSETNNENIIFIKLLDEHLDFFYKEQSQINLDNTQVLDILSSKVFDDWTGKTSLTQQLTQSHNFQIQNFNELKSNIESLSRAIRNSKITFSTSIFIKEKDSLIDTFRRIMSAIDTNKQISFKLKNEFNLYLKKSDITNIKPIIVELSELLISNINTIVSSCSKYIAICQTVASHIIQVNERFQYETSKDFNKKFDREKNLIIEDFNLKLNKSLQDNELTIKKLRSDLDRTSSEFKRISHELEQSHEKNLLLVKQIDEISLTLNQLIIEEDNKIRNKLTNISESLLQQIENKQNDIDSHFNNAKETHLDFVKLVEKAGIYNLTENYKNKANEEKTEYKDYRKYTTYSILAAVVFTLAVFIFAFWEQSAPNSSPNYLILVSRLSISAMFFILALYLSKQASKHYECYQENHRTFLQLAALEPFMARMTPEEQKEIRKGLIPSYFNQNADGKYAAKGDEVDMALVYNLLDKASNLVHGNKKESTESNGKV